jgi:hypothetical protein
MTDTKIGQWATRRTIRDGWMMTLSHMVQSEIADRVVTKCGRQMPRKNSKGELVFTDFVSTYDRCRWCQ